MSTPDVRDALLAEIRALAGSVPVFDIDDYLSATTLPPNDENQCILVQFAPSSERITTIGAPSTVGFEESGLVGIHWLYPTGYAVSPILAVAEPMRLALRGRRLSSPPILIEGTDPFSASSSPISSLSGWTAVLSTIQYTLRTC